MANGAFAHDGHPALEDGGQGLGVFQQILVQEQLGRATGALWDRGVEVTPMQAYLFTVLEPILTEFEEPRELYAPNGRILGEGDIPPDLRDVDVKTCSPYYNENFVTHGYTVAYVPTRGAGGTDSCADLMGPKERSDLDQAVTWLGSQEWSNGSVGMTGAAAWTP